MDLQMKKKARMEVEDRISMLPDELVHQIMLFMEIRFAVQTSVLSKRWKLLWTTLPFINSRENKREFFDHLFILRNQQSPIIKLELCLCNGLNLSFVKKYINYAILRNLERLHVDINNRSCPLRSFSSNLLKDLRLRMKFETAKLMESHCWSLPNLTTLHLEYYNDKRIYEFPQSCLICLPALTTLGLKYFKLPESFSLPALRTLRLESCTLPQQVWDFPALLTLELTQVVFPRNLKEYLLALTSLQNLAIDFGGYNIGFCIISSSQLQNLKIRVPFYTDDLTKGKIVVLAPKLCNFTAIGCFLTRFEGCKLDNVNIRFWNCMYDAPPRMSKKFHDLFHMMFSQLGSAKILSLDLMTLKELSRISDILEHLRSPFYNLKYFKLPRGYEKSSISSSVSKYLLGGSPGAKTLSPDHLIPQMPPVVPVITDNVVVEEPVATSTTEMVNYHCTHKSTRGDNLDMRMPKEDILDNPVVHADKMRHIEAPVAGESNDGASSWEKSNLVLWRGHEVYSGFVGLLDLIMRKYPQTFEKLPTENKKIWTMKLNMLCSSVNAFTKTTMAEVNVEMINEYGDLFRDLRRWGFNISWLMRRLNYIRQHYEFHAIDLHINNAKSKLQDLPSLRAEKMTNSESYQTIDCYVGDGVL